MRTAIKYILVNDSTINILRKLEKEIIEDGSEHGCLTTMIVDAKEPAYVVSWCNDYDEMISLFANDDTKHLVGTTYDCPEYYKWWED